MAGELIRVLINHPDVEIMWVDSARFTGRLVSDVHHGLLGETALRISPSSYNELDDIDALFIFRHKGQTIEWLSERQIPENLRIIDLSVDMRDQALAEANGFVYGLPELNRKAMVRGAMRAIVPHPAANIAALALMPLAKAQALEGKVAISMELPAAAEQVGPDDDVAAETSRALSELWPECSAQIDVKAAPAADDRAMQAVAKFESKLDIGELLRIYGEFYDDHSFTFIIDEKPEAKEVAGTNKCLMHIEKANGEITISAMMDAMLKGAAGTAVHDMNLLFGLHEKVGLQLKASTF